jgi:hypothetical protein
MVVYILISKFKTLKPSTLGTLKTLSPKKPMREGIV